MVHPVAVGEVALRQVSQVKARWRVELLELGTAEKLISKTSNSGLIGKLAGELTPVTSGPVGLPCRLLVVNWVVMIFVHLHII